MKADTSLIQAKAKSIREAQDVKDLKIAFFNSTNSAIALVTQIPQLMTDKTTMLNAVVDLREWFLEEHRQHNLRMQEQTGATVQVGDALTKLKAVNNIVDLRALWATFTQDERNIQAVKDEANRLRLLFKANTGSTK